MAQLSAVPASFKLVYLPLVIIVASFLFMIYFNKVVIDRRLEELSYLLENASQSQDQNASGDHLRTSQRPEDHHQSHERRRKQDGSQIVAPLLLHRPHELEPIGQ